MTRVSDQRWKYGDKKKILDIVNANRGDKVPIDELNMGKWLRGYTKDKFQPPSVEVARQICSAAQEIGHYITIKDIREPKQSRNPLITHGRSVYQKRKRGEL